MDPYQRLGVGTDASQDEIRDAYRALARRLHPDAVGGDAAAMADVNEAWRLIGSPSQRTRYDRDRAHGNPRASTTSTAAASSAAAPRRAPSVAPQKVEPARFPWRFMAVLAAIGMLFVAIGVATARPIQPSPPDRLLRSGTCVTISPTLDAIKVSCTEPHDGVVDQLVPFDSTCAQPAAAYRDPQGMGTACVVLAER